MDGAVRHDALQDERRLRLSAERMLDHVRDELLSAHRSLSAHVEKVSHQYLVERDARIRLTGRTDRVAAERRAAETRADRTDRRLWHAVEAIRDGFAIWDADARLVHANKPFVQMFDGAVDAEPGVTYDLLLRAAVEDGVIDTGDVAPDAWIADMLARRAAGSDDPVPILLYDGRTVRLQDRRTEDGDVVSLAVDVTAEVEREAALRRARTEAEAAVQAKSRFLARMSHEFRTPMNGVIGMADLLLEGEMEDEARQCVATIRDSGLSLLDIVNDVLDAARLEAGKMTLRPAPFDLERTLIQVVRLAGASGGAAASVSLDYPLDAPTRFLGDEARIRQVATNLVGNAVKFAAGGDVTVRLRATRPEGGDAARLAIEVVDTGPGIPADRRAFVFGEFARLDGQQGEGAGLGLSIARDVARLMEGDLRLLDGTESDASGAHFEMTCTLPLAHGWPAPPRLPRTVRMPRDDGAGAQILAGRLRSAGVSVAPMDAPGGAPILVPLDVPARAQAALAGAMPAGRLILVGARSRAAAALAARADAVLGDPCEGAALAAALTGKGQTPRPAPGGPRRLRILAADDVATNRLLMRKMLADPEREVVLVDDGDVAVERFAAEAFDLVLLDISMPRMDGRDAARAIRAAPGGATVPIVAMTAHADPTEIEDIRAAGVDEVLVKPVRKPQLLKLLADLATRRD